MNYEEEHGWKIVIEENGTQRKTYLIATIPTTYCTKIGLGLNPALHEEKLANNSLSHGTEVDVNKRMKL